jgi:muramidase (phage lysozyme)
MTAANLPREARALLDAIARGESDPTAKAEGISPYYILYGGGSFGGFPERLGYAGFPEWEGKDNSHAAGRYQFEPATWKGILPWFGYTASPNFRNPDDQDWGAWFLAQQDYGARTGRELISDLAQGRIDNVGGILRPTWTSMSDATFPGRYAAALAVTPSTPAPAPTPAPSGPVFIPAKPKPAPAAATPGSPEVTAAAIVLLQTILAVDGYYAGPMDGLPNDTLTAALGKYRDWLDRPTS